MKQVSAIAASLALAAVPMVGATTAYADQAAPQKVTTKGVGAQNVLSCTTDTPDGREGWARCRNNTARVVAFRAVVVCGMAPDVHGDWVTLNPGQSGASGRRCGIASTGVGSVSWEEG
ncbi:MULTISPECIES: hypothetical protein [unclassified Streptomyces]|uniref:hypothetical protein n=1 Tax=unclassified Streptomyces TaxID=2593676 RepID=UPI000C27DC6A|nr:hypothetical protein [Streptomyces sp. CB02959]PJN38388.1 hypothetical protein CG747_22275 [Streptomyces sp. CB02959]